MHFYGRSHNSTLVGMCFKTLFVAIVAIVAIVATVHDTYHTMYSGEVGIFYRKQQQWLD